MRSRAQWWYKRIPVTLNPSPRPQAQPKSRSQAAKLGLKPEQRLHLEHALPIGLVDVKVAAIDDDWSGLRLVWRVEHRSGAAGPPH